MTLIRPLERAGTRSGDPVVDRAMIDQIRAAVGASGTAALSDVRTSATQALIRELWRRGLPRGAFAKKGRRSLMEIFGCIGVEKRQSEETIGSDRPPAAC
jgi:hypothetical protein